MHETHIGAVFLVGDPAYKLKKPVGWTDHADPELTAPTDAIVRIDAVTICGTDLHILKGDVPELERGRILGHEAVGTIVETGSAVTTVKAGDKVLVSCISACGRCEYRRQAAYGQCLGGGGWILGHTTDGVHAEYAGSRSPTPRHTCCHPGWAPSRR